MESERPSQFTTCESGRRTNGVRFAYVTAARSRRARTLAALATSVPPDVTQLEEDDHGEHREEEERDRRSLAEVAALQADLIGERREQVRGVHGTAAREDLHDVEVAEREDGGEEDHHRQHRLEQR